MRTLELPDQLEWTPELLERLPPDMRYEVSEGKLVVMSAAMRPWQSDVRYRIMHPLRTRKLAAYSEQGVVTSGGEIGTCDVGVFRNAPEGERAYHPASVFSLLVEVVSDSSRRRAARSRRSRTRRRAWTSNWRVEEATDGEAVVYRYGLVEVSGGPATYAELRVTTLSALEDAG